MNMTFQQVPRITALSTILRRRLKAQSYQFETEVGHGNRQVLVDVSVIVKQDARTGIQRVVRALLGQLVALARSDLTIQPVFASRDHGYCRATFSEEGLVTAANHSLGVLHRVNVRPGDIFLGLDLAAQVLPHAELDLARWRRDGVSINIVVYDLLPLTNPEWFPARTVRNFKRWFGVIVRQADRCICISREVASLLKGMITDSRQDGGPEIFSIPLGADLGESFPTKGLPEDIAALRSWLQSHRTLLSVGTIEPRKGHNQILAALEHLWQIDPDSNIGLIIVGRPGWKTETLQLELRSHPETGKRLHWIDGASDELLAELYSRSSGLIAASYGEGFGLPLVEALAHGIPVLARDLPIFHEIGGQVFDFFSDDAPDALADRISVWLNKDRNHSIASLPTWADSAGEIMRLLGMPKTTEERPQ